MATKKPIGKLLSQLPPRSMVLTAADIYADDPDRPKLVTEDALEKRLENFEGGGGGSFDPDVSAVAIGLDATAYGGKAIAIGERAAAYGDVVSTLGGVAIGSDAWADSGSVSIGGPECSCGYGARSVACSVVIGAGACGQCLSVAVGYKAGSYTEGVAIGSLAASGARGSVVVGALSCSCGASTVLGSLTSESYSTGSVVVGAGASTDQCTTYSDHSINILGTVGCYSSNSVVIGRCAQAFGSPFSVVIGSYATAAACGASIIGACGSNTLSYSTQLTSYGSNQGGASLNMRLVSPEDSTTCATGDSFFDFWVVDRVGQITEGVRISATDFFAMLKNYGGTANVPNTGGGGCY